MRRIFKWLLISVLCGTALAVFFPALARFYVQKRFLPAIAARLGRQVQTENFSPGLRLVTMKNVTFRGPHDGQQPFAKIPELQVRVMFWPLLRGIIQAEEVVLNEPVFSLRRGADGKDNFSDLLKRKMLTGGGGSVRIQELVFEEGQVFVHDEQVGLKFKAHLSWGKAQPGGSSAVNLDELELHLPLLPKPITFTEAQASGELRGGQLAAFPHLELRGGKIVLPGGLELSAVSGNLGPAASNENLAPTSQEKIEAARKIYLTLKGSYAGSEEQLWSAKGWLLAEGPQRPAGEVRVKAAQFNLGRLAAYLQRSPLMQPQQTQIDGELKISFGQGKVAFAGDVQIEHLNLFHPGLARTALLNLNPQLFLGGEFDWRHQLLTIDRLEFRHRDLNLRLSGTIERVWAQPLIRLRLQVPKISCQQFLDSVPPSLLPQLDGFVLKGDFAPDLRTSIDYQNFDEVELSGNIGFDKCKIISAPEELAAERLLEPFEHKVEIKPGEEWAFTVGSQDEFYTPLNEISPYVISAFLTTEDAGFFKHRGFLISQFRAALARNLKQGGFRLGASTISMQMVKNVLLTREKTLARKLQELFLTWYIEQTLTKERIMEIYLNVIEFGPGIYGIGKAASHYFGKKPKDITALEAAYFATILPSPKRRYAQYCHGSLSDGWDRYVRRVLNRMWGKGFVKDAEMSQAAQEKIMFLRDLEGLPEKQCLEELQELLDSWKEEDRRRLEEVVRAAAPHQVEMYVPPPEPAELLPGLPPRKPDAQAAKPR